MEEWTLKRTYLPTPNCTTVASGQSAIVPRLAAPQTGVIRSIRKALWLGGKIIPTIALLSSDLVSITKLERRHSHDKRGNGKNESDAKVPKQQPNLPLLYLLTPLGKALRLDDISMKAGRDPGQALEDAANGQRAWTIGHCGFMRRDR